MALGWIFRFTGRVAALGAMAALLLQVSCTIGLPPLVKAEAPPPAHSGCHDSAPATPETPAPGQKCCNGEHSPLALMTAPPVPATPFAITEAIYELIGLSFASHDTAEIVTPSSGPPRLLALRI